MYIERERKRELIITYPNVCSFPSLFYLFHSSLYLNIDANSNYALDKIYWIKTHTHVGNKNGTAKEENTAMYIVMWLFIKPSRWLFRGINLVTHKPVALASMLWCLGWKVCKVN